jgi:ribosomal protein L2
MLVKRLVRFLHFSCEVCALHIKDLHITIDPSNTRAILTIKIQDGSTIELVADPDQVKKLQKVVQYTANHIAATNCSSFNFVVN